MNSLNQKICFILLPGFSPDVVSVLGLKRILEQRGYDAIAANFYGDIDVSDSDFSILRAEQCVRSVSKIINDAAKKYERVFGIGVSLGGALLLEHAKKFGNITGITSIGTPFKLKKRFLMRLGQKAVFFVYPLWKRFQKKKEWRLFPIGAGNMIIEYLENDFLKNLELIKTPTLFLHSKKDRITDYLALSEFSSKISTKYEIAFFENGNHVLDRNPELILKYALDFFGLGKEEETGPALEKTAAIAV